MIECLTALAISVSNFSSADSDIEKDVSAFIFEQAMVVARNNDNMRRAAICAANAATALLEKTKISKSDFTRIESNIAFSLDHKTKGTVDWWYSQFAQGLYLQKSGINDAAQLRRAATTMANALEKLVRDLATDQYVLGRAQVCQCEYLAYDLEVTTRDTRLLELHLHELTETVVDLSTLHAAEVVGLLKSNPKALGLDETPKWVTTGSPDQALKTAKSSLRRAHRMLQVAIRSSPGISSLTQTFANMQLMHSGIRLEYSSKSVETFVQSLSKTDVMPGGHQQEFISTMEALIRAQNETSFGLPAPVLKLLARTYLAAVDEAASANVQQFALRQGSLARFLSCWLADAGDWTQAFTLLEASRSLLAPNRRDEEFVSEDWLKLHVTHDPTATYLVGKVGMSYCGTVISELSGRHLARLWYGISASDPGVSILERAGDRSGYNSRLAGLSGEFEVLVDSIDQLSGAARCIALSVGGLHSITPLASMIEVAYPSKYAAIVVTPRTSDLSRDEGVELDRQGPVKASVLSVAGNPTFGLLPFAKLESEIITQSLDASGFDCTYLENCTLSRAMTALHDDSIVHFSGHSFSDDFDPNNSSLIFSDGLLAAATLRSARTQAILITLSSCESGLVSSDRFADEALSIQSALLQAGAKHVIGSSWKLLDLPSCILFVKFYELLLDHEWIDTSVIYRCLVGAQGYVRDLTREAIQQKYDSFPLPLSIVRLPAESRPFEHFWAWGGLQLSSSAL
ncbi:CHAT domain-containing protein [Tersicoccus solisilvae]|uniref:CHAT domain-containing protein n=1 Tax=Tersicoccus solisilvae TaxID=1882339 RepID=UPI001666A33A|nr:CHAT domain-containing protein [Tersicoccus solisilvae]